jgi:hypothetical protein
MKFTLNRVVHYYYLTVLILITATFGYGIYSYWNSGILNIDFVSNLYDGTNKVKLVKDRNDLDELRKNVENDRFKEALKVMNRIEVDIRDLKSIKTIEDQSSFNNNYTKIKTSLTSMQSSPELTGILTGVISKVTQFESFVTEKKWPTLMRMSTSLRNKTSQARIVSSGMYNFERIQNLSQSINNDLEAMSNFTQSSSLTAEIKSAIINRINSIRKEAEGFNKYIDEHKNFNKLVKEFSNDYSNWFKLVEPEIALKKIQFEKSSQSLIISLVALMTVFMASIVLGVMINNYISKRNVENVEKLILDTVKDELIPTDCKNTNTFSTLFKSEITKYHDYIHRRMTFGSIFQEAVPFATILLDSNLNLVWGNGHFYQDWKLENFKDESDTLTWDFLQRFTNLEDNSSILTALRLSTSGKYKIQVKTTSMDNTIPYEMHVSPVDYAGQKRIMIIFYPFGEVTGMLNSQRESIISPVISLIEAQKNGSITPDMRKEIIVEADKHHAGALVRKVYEYIDLKELEMDAMNLEVEKLEAKLHEQRNIINEIRKSVVQSFETQRSSVDEYNKFKLSISNMIDSRDQIEEQMKFTMSATREIYKDQSKIVSLAEKAEQSVDEYIRSLKTITGLKSEFKDLRMSVEDFKSRIVQVLDQLLVFQNHEGDTLKIDQFLGKIKIEMKGFEKILYDFNQVVTQLDVTVTKIDMMVEDREKVDLSAIKNRMENLKNTIDNVQFSASKITQNTHLKDEELVSSLKNLVGNLKSEMKRVDEMCKVTGLTENHLNVISPRQESRV